jgi:hypothetical protein
MDFNTLISKSNSNLDKFREASEKETAKSFKDQDGYWQPQVDAAGNGYAVIRFLPPSAADGEDALPWVKFFHHGFQGPTGLWYIEKSRTTLGQDDPVSEYNSKLWATNLESNKKIVREQKRKLTYVSNIYVVSDPKNPENEGKVFRFKYGKKIYDKILEAMDPKKTDPFSDKDPIDPFHFILGANFKLKIRKVEGYRNYDKSEFAEVSPLLGGDATKLKAVWEQQYSLKELIAQSEFKDYATLKQRLDRVLGIDTSGVNATGVSASVDTTDSGKGLLSKTAATAEGVDLGEDTDPDLFKSLAQE